MCRNKNEPNVLFNGIGSPTLWFKVLLALHEPWGKLFLVQCTAQPRGGAGDTTGESDHGLANSSSAPGDERALPSPASLFLPPFHAAVWSASHKACQEKDVGADGIIPPGTMGRL